MNSKIKDKKSPKNKQKRFYSLMTDTTAKYMLKNKTTRPFFEKIILELTNVDIRGFYLYDLEINTGNDGKDYRMDIVLKKDNVKVNIEFVSSYNSYYQNKNKSYLFSLAGNSFKERENYNHEYRVIQISFNGFKNNDVVKKNDDIDKSNMKFLDVEHNIISEYIESFDLYIPKIIEMGYNCSNDMKLFMCKSLTELKKLKVDSKEAKSVMSELERLNEVQGFGALYDVEEEKQRLLNSERDYGISLGIEKGI